MYFDCNFCRLVFNDWYSIQLLCCRKVTPEKVLSLQHSSDITKLISSKLYYKMAKARHSGLHKGCCFYYQNKFMLIQWRYFYTTMFNLHTWEVYESYLSLFFLLMLEVQSNGNYICRNQRYPLSPWPAPKMPEFKWQQQTQQQVGCKSH